MQVLYVAYDHVMRDKVARELGSGMRDTKRITLLGGNAHENYMFASFGAPICGRGFNLILVEENWAAWHYKEGGRELRDKAIQYYRDIHCRLYPGGVLTTTSLGNEVMKRLSAK